MLRVGIDPDVRQAHQFPAGAFVRRRQAEDGAVIGVGDGKIYIVAIVPIAHFESERTFEGGAVQVS